MHPLNRHRGRYDLKKLSARVPELEPLIIEGKTGEATLDFSHPASVKLLNRALLLADYGVHHWDLPPHYLCPPVPGRADHIHTVAEILGGQKGQQVRVLDVGVGANCIYPIIGAHEYGWTFVGSDTDPGALTHAQSLIDANPLLHNVSLRPQNGSGIFKGVIQTGEAFDLTICNPPFHSSPEEARQGSDRKWKNLGKSVPQGHLNFGGYGGELWCPGGERAFLLKMIKESLGFVEQVNWFTSLVSREAHLTMLQKALQGMHARQIKVLSMQQGQKKSRILAWSFR
jgi:23S rRNA (adenine1618-N6)-methyltransferase